MCGRVLNRLAVRGIWLHVAVGKVEGEPPRLNREWIEKPLFVAFVAVELRMGESIVVPFVT
jgi:hypothetical protein